jgi:hypothetical protein
LPIMDKLYVWLAKQKTQHPPKSVMGNAINYTLKNWQAQASGALNGLMVERTDHQDATRMIAAPIALLVGVVLSSIGLRSLQPLFEPSDAVWLKSTQGRLFSFVDIVLTAALLAGGSEGIHWMVALYRDWTDKNRSSKS